LQFAAGSAKLAGIWFPEPGRRRTVAPTAAGSDDRPDLPPDVLQRAAATFGLLAATMRFHIIWLLAAGECDVGTLAERTGGSLPAVSQHLAKLKLAGLVASRREGRRQVYLVADVRMAGLVRQVADSLGREQAGPGWASGAGA
jgi:DNA-binding transcriptional ArsR family regulator